MTPRASSETLTDLEDIRRWAEERDAWPACVHNTGGRDDVGVIRLAFSGYSGARSLEEISWDEWFQKFEDNHLALIVQNQTARGRRSNFNKIVGRDTVAERARRKARTSRRARAGRSARRTRTSGHRRSPQSARRAGRSRSARPAAATRSSRTARLKPGTPARRSRSGSRRGGARVVSISSGRSRRAPARTSRKRISGRTKQSRPRAA
jgi:hypothetical protein